LASVELRNAWKIYGGKVHAVIDASWKCEDGEFFSILGPSGCGKSSTLRMIAGLEEITRGQILLDGEVVNRKSPSQRNVAMVFENWALYPNLTVYENIAFPLRVRRVPRQMIDDKVKDVLRFLRLERIQNTNVRRLSGGEMQRVAIGRAIVRKPAVLIMDEPISHLDAGLREEMRDELKAEVNQLGVTTLYITHDQVESMAMADRIAIMNLGRIQQIGTPLEIYREPSNEFVGGFIGEPPMNFIDCELIAEGEQLSIASPAFKLELQADVGAKLATHAGMRTVRLGVRPEDVLIEAAAGPGTFAVPVDFAEQEGDRTIISLRMVPSVTFLAQVLGSLRPAIGETLHVSFDQRHIHFFDIETGVNLLVKDQG
jgi:multiple sugar transport system ATP-binding protein